MVGLQIYRNKSLILIHTEKGKESYKCCNKTATREGNITTANLGSFYITQRLYSDPPFLSSSNTQNHQEKANHIVSLLFASLLLLVISNYHWIIHRWYHLRSLCCFPAYPLHRHHLSWTQFWLISVFTLFFLWIGSGTLCKLYTCICIYIHMRLWLSRICERSFRI